VIGDRGAIAGRRRVGSGFALGELELRRSAQPRDRQAAHCGHPDDARGHPQQERGSEAHDHRYEEDKDGVGFGEPAEQHLPDGGEDHRERLAQRPVGEKAGKGPEILAGDPPGQREGGEQGGRAECGGPRLTQVDGEPSVRAEERGRVGGGDQGDRHGHHEAGEPGAANERAHAPTVASRPRLSRVA